MLCFVMNFVFALTCTFEPIDHGVKESRADGR